MEELERHSGNDASDPIFDFADGSINFINRLFVGGGVHNNIYIISYIALLNSMYMRTVFTIMLLLEYILITLLKFYLTDYLYRLAYVRQ